MAYRRQSVRVKNPHLRSMAAAVLLERKLRDEELADWFLFRSWFLAKQKALNGELICHYCGKTGLQEDINKVDSEDLLATIDHVIPRSKGGPEKDESNLVVACYPCNQKKKDKVLHE